MTKIIRTAAFANVGRGYRSVKQVRDNIMRCYTAAPEGDWSFAEIGEKDPKFANESVLLTNVFGVTHKIFGLKHRTPNAIFEKKGRRIIGRPQIKGCDGIEKWNPARFITETIVVDDPDFDIPVVRINTHYPRRNNKNGADQEIDKLDAKIKQRIHYWLDRNYVVEGSFDRNDIDEHKVLALHPDLKILVKAGIDYIWVVTPKDIKSRKLSAKVVPMNIDGHNGHVVRYSLTD